MKTKTIVIDLPETLCPSFGELLLRSQLSASELAIQLIAEALSYREVDQVTLVDEE